MGTPLKAVRRFCLDCMCGSAREVKLCPSEDCSFFSFRLGKGRANAKVIRKFCFQCGEGTAHDIKHCVLNGKDSDLCSMYEYRLGKNPKKRGNPKNLTNYRGNGANLAKWRFSRRGNAAESIIFEGSE